MVCRDGRYFYYLELKNNPYDLIGEVEKGEVTFSFLLHLTNTIEYETQ